MFGKLTWDAIPWSQPIPLVAGAVVVLAVLAILVWVVLKGYLPYLWREWITSVDHKRIGVMYTLLGVVMLLRGFIDAIMMRSQQAIAFRAAGYLPPEHYDQIFSAHGTIMIFFAAMPIVIGLMNFVGPLQLGVRDLGFHFFTNDAGGNMMMFINLIWAWGHPEVYILVLPAFGIFSEVISTFSGKPLFNYRSMVAATMFICLVSYMVWLHHFFTMGAGADVNAFFGISTSIIAVGTGVKVYNWLFTMYGGRIRFTTPMLWSLGFLVTFTIGGMTGVLLAVPPADFLLHNSLFLVAHFHNVIIGGVVFAAFAGVTYWFPKAFGFKLDEGWGKAAFWLSLIGFYVVFMPLYVAGLLGMTRRLQHYDVAAWRPWVLIAGLGIVIMIAAGACQVVQFVVSVRRREQLRDATGDPWDGRSLEWATTSPPP